MKLAHVLLAASLLALAACGGAASLNEGERLNWRCADGKSFSLRYVANAAEVFAAGHNYRLPAGGTSGSYSNGDVTYTEDGGKASLTGAYGGPFENCRRMRRWL